MSTQSNAWQDRDSVLAQFSQREAEAKEAYRRYIAEGVVLGMRPELLGGEWIGSGMVCGEIAAATQD